ncbi:MAG TPA: 3-phosphoserine/phosphohydroxythreonine transaminase [Burkholderiales bacterium]|nr:3-phosphoserine/phosphohydroxythreonine transaminase [Burkholderiales bacterium]
MLLTGSRRRTVTPGTTYNFAGGPSMLPASVLAQVREEFAGEELAGESGRPTILEAPFSSARFRSLIEDTELRLRRLVGISDEYVVLFLQGGATAQFALVPLNLLGNAGRADYIETGYWSHRAIEEAQRYGWINVASSGAASHFSSIPKPDGWRLDPRAAYVHITSNETADGLEYHWTPDVGSTALVSDMTAAFLTRPIDVARYAVIYASAQKNLGVAGLTLVVVRRDVLGRAHPHTPSTFHYARQADARSMLNTPPMFAIYVANLILQWLDREGGLAEMEQRAQQRSDIVYAAIDRSDGFYRCPVERQDRSRINICFRPANNDLTPLFLEQAMRHGLLNLAGHGRIGGLRASLYNAMPVAGAHTLAQWLGEFARRYG